MRWRCVLLDLVDPPPADPSGTYRWGCRNGDVDYQARQTVDSGPFPKHEACGYLRATGQVVIPSAGVAFVWD